MADDVTSRTAGTDREFALGSDHSANHDRAVDYEPYLSPLLVLGTAGNEVAGARGVDPVDLHFDDSVIKQVQLEYLSPAASGGDLLRVHSDNACAQCRRLQCRIRAGYERGLYLREHTRFRGLATVR